ncbi:Gfo/Idh/MocA family oxidoreductase [Butyricicoccus faecihominis]|uniref:Gfo/Idh/MocA family protein n=1 Tax=Butyricicoccus faecihominis TaxID=1712515 RepID=UPI00247938EA|nr:Gfo/Idh/MocA family oxidoreductase [Butyricicoccus faecihominis]MCQ5130530.1 Gfo/Idh/MocA family oxidoreductase [Butyricicoccus faecihominis]
MKTVIVGAGAIAYAHAKACRALNVEIVGVFDIRAESAKKLADEYHAAVLVDMEQYEKAVQGADMVHLCTPPSLRLAYAEIAMKAGCHVVTEKPMAIAVEDARKMCDMAERYGVQIMVDYNHRFRPGFQKLLEIVRSGQIGDIVDAFVYRAGMLGGNAGTKNDTWRRKPGLVCGMSIESLSHDIDMIIQLAGPVRDVKADVRGTYAEIPEFDNNVHVSLNMESGAMALVNASWSSYMKGSTRGVIGTKGTVYLEGDDLFDFTRLRIRTDEMECEQEFKLNDIYNLATCPSYTNATRHFLDVIEGKAENAVSGAYALRTLEISHAILDSAKAQRVVAVS